MMQSFNLKVSQKLITPLFILYGKKKAILYAEVLTTLVITRTVLPFPLELNKNMELDSARIPKNTYITQIRV
jgi:hypothetical protein